MSRPIFLIGYMASGKTTLGHAVSRDTGIDFIDLDDFIVEREGLSISELFSQGEDVFRSAERSALCELLRPGRGKALIACGGGTPCFGDNMELMNSAGVTVLLEADHDVLISRLKLFRAQRPLLRDLDDDALVDFVERSMASRRPFYEKAAARFDSSRLETESQVAESSRIFISKFMSDDTKQTLP